MKPVFSRLSFSFASHRWQWLKFGFYLFYFFLIQIINSPESFTHFAAITSVYIVVVGIIEVNQYCLHLCFRRERYLIASLTLVSSYSLLAMITFYVLHRSDNFIATEIWDRQFEASWGTFMPTFSKLYWTFFKYAVILFLAKQVLLIFRLLPFSDAAKLITVPETKAALSDQSDKELTAQCDREVENALPPLEKVDRSNERWDSSGLLPVRVGRVTYILDVFNIVYLEVHDDTTTVYQKDGSDIAVKYPLSKFYNRLPKGRFVRVNESRVVALPYVWKDNDGHIYMRSYEDKGLKLGRQDKFPEYKEWKDRNKLK